MSFLSPSPAFGESTSRLDRLQLAAVLGLILLGLAFVFSATMISESALSQPLIKQLWFRQLFWYGVGGGAAVLLCLVDYHTWTRWGGFIYWVSIVTLVAVMLFGTVRGGARRWFDLGFVSLQPSELAKLAFVLALANFLSRPPDELRLPVNFWKALALMGLPVLLIMKEPDLGSALVFIPTGLAMMLVAGVPRRFLFRLLGAGSIVATLFLVDILFAPPHWQIKLEEYQRHRLLVYFGQDFAPPDATKEQKQRMAELRRQKSYQPNQALRAVGSGGFWGKGWRQGSQTALGFLPPGAAHTDFIFSVIAEEKGFIGSVMVLTLYGIVLFTGLRIADRARDRLGKVLAAGVVTLLFSHIFINIGMNIRLMPVTGIPLPLLSYGGSSVLASMIAIGMLQNVHLYRKGY
ncbi:MAG TPA: rod shape-determining protein RodA [Verrucomicrobiota bacterium]|nr:rod shape-determining protein RodA [Verrucomicrobiota bacterium]HNT14981.1 rod shape-determining protein RodA [Verrucomicrobiota bacterium]